MKKVTFTKTWRWPLSDTSYEEYAKGDAVEISDDRAAKAAADDAVDTGSDAPARKSRASRAKTKAPPAPAEAPASPASTPSPDA